MMAVFKNINIGLSFLLELAMLAGFGYWGFFGEKETWLKWALGIGLPVIAAAAWGLFFAPKAVRRLNSPAGPGLSLILFLLAAAALFFAQQPGLAIALGAVALLNRALVLLWKQW